VFLMLEMYRVDGFNPQEKGFVFLRNLLKKSCV
jgi:hypothetical protein